MGTGSWLRDLPVNVLVGMGAVALTEENCL